MEPKSKLSSRFPSRDVFFGTSSDLPRIVELDMAAIVTNPDQPRQRIDPERLRELADSITAHGLIHPITVRRADGDTYMVIAGERRFRAFALLAHASIPAIISEGSSDELALIENIQREDLSPLDEYHAIARLIDQHGYSQGDAATALGKSRTSINEILSLAGLAPAIRDEAQTASVSKSVLVEIARAGDEAAQEELWGAVQAGASTVRALRDKRVQGKIPAKRANIAQELSPVETAIRAGRRFVDALAAIPGEERESLADARAQVERSLALLENGDRQSDANP